MLCQVYPEGKMSKLLGSLDLGQSIAVTPAGSFDYKPNQYQTISMLAGGTGITPFYSILKQALADSTDNTKFRVLYANRTEADILLKTELDALTLKFPELLTIKYLIDRPRDIENSDALESQNIHVASSWREELRSFVGTSKPNSTVMVRTSHNYVAQLV
jgi:ferredoxin-NADP reductase